MLDGALVNRDDLLKVFDGPGVELFCERLDRDGAIVQVDDHALSLFCQHLVANAAGHLSAVSLVGA